MLERSLRILDFDGSVTAQTNLIEQYHPRIIDLRNFGPKVRLWMDAKLKREIESAFSDSPKNAVTFLGSGDFHHLSYLLLDRFEEDFSLIVFDHHPDWDILPPRLGCGSWVTQSLKEKNIKKCVLIGVSSSDISSGSIQSGDLGSLGRDRLEIYPYSHKPSLVFFKKVPDNVSLRRKSGLVFNKIHWSELKGKNLQGFFQSILKRLPTRKVYVSIDKDCLKSEYSLTNWEEGELTLEELLLMLRLIKENLDIIGLDIVGDYSPVSISGRFKTALSRLDHPKDFSASGVPDSLIKSTNEDTNLQLIKMLLS